MLAIEAKDGEAWVALFADDAVVEEPIVPAMFDPEGKADTHRPQG